ncbi:MAG: hypothetical protein ACJ76N_08290 [Thermoanaerobaculia bacterium]
MSKPIFRRLIAVLALSAFLGSPATSLAGPRSAARHSRTQAQTPLSWLWNALVSVWEKEGCHIDPYGRCVTVSRPVMDEDCAVGSNSGCFNTALNRADKEM